MRDLTDKHLELLCEMSEIQLKWFQLYSPESKMTYEDVLKLNHIKLISISEGCLDCSEDMLDFIFESIIRDYKEMLDDYKPGLDDII